jgi:hypothetical protein
MLILILLGALFMVPSVVAVAFGAEFVSGTLPASVLLLYVAFLLSAVQYGVAIAAGQGHTILASGYRNRMLAALALYILASLCWLWA